MTSSIKVNTISEVTSANGVTIDGVSLKDGGATFTGTVTGIPASAGASLVHISSGTLSGTPATVVFSGIDSTYTNYQIILSHVLPSADNKDLYCVIGSSTSSYDSSYNGIATQASDAYGPGLSYITSTAAVFVFGGIADSATWGGVNANIFLYNPSSSSTSTALTYTYLYHDYNDKYRTGSGGSHTDTAEATTALKFYWGSSATFGSGNIDLYGIKNA